MNDSAVPPAARLRIVVGVGEGLGAALARRFAAGYKVARFARSKGVIARTADEIRRGRRGVADPMRCDDRA